MRTLSDDYLFLVIKHGGGLFGKPGMPSWGQKLTDSEIRALVVYVRRFSSPRPQSPPAGDAR
jgi:mono/diheme cytochrome c family protein